MRLMSRIGERRKHWVLVLVLGLIAPTFSPAKTIFVDDDGPINGDGCSWATAYRFLQDALVDANDLQEEIEIRIAQGVYRPDCSKDHPAGTRDRKASFVVHHGLILRGGYAGVGALDPNERDMTTYETILSGDLANDDQLCDDTGTLPVDPTRSDNSYHVVKALVWGWPPYTATARRVVLDGLSICAGNANKAEQYNPDASGGGMYVHSMNLSLKDCIFRNNSAFDFGGGLYAHESEVAIYRCTFICNVAFVGDIFAGSGGGVAYDAGSAWADPAGEINTHKLNLLKCIIQENQAWSGGGVWTKGAQGKIADCIFQKNFAQGTGGAISLFGYSDIGTIKISDSIIKRNIARDGGGIDVANGNVTVSGCDISGNHALAYGGGIRSGGGTYYVDLVVRDCLISGNRAGDVGGGMRILNSSYVSNCTISDNWTSLWGGGIFSRAAILTNNILWGNIAGNRMDESAQINDYRPTISWSCIQGLSSELGGLGNMDADPCFAVSGYWTNPGRPDDTPDLNDIDTIWVDGDYHLMSQGGRWDPLQGRWCMDEVTSSCIDAADPRGGIGCEPFPNGGRRNMGFYGATAEASKSFFGEPPCDTILAGDINGDCRVDRADYELLLVNWMGSYTPGAKVTTTYEFRYDPKAFLYCTGNNRRRESVCNDLSVAGCFSITVDANAGMAWIGEMKAFLSKEVEFWHDSSQEAIFTNELAVLYRVNELAGTKVTDQEVVLELTDPSGNVLSSLTLTFRPGLIQLTDRLNRLDTTADVTGFIFHDD